MPRRGNGEGIWRHCPKWARPFVAAAPWAGFAMVLCALAFARQKIATEPGIVVELPEGEAAEGAASDMVAIAARVPGLEGESETIVFFDDGRYLLADEASRSALAQAIGARAAVSASGTLVLLADGKLSAGELIAIAELARKGGAKAVQIAEKAAR